MKQKSKKFLSLKSVLGLLQKLQMNHPVYSFEVTASHFNGNGNLSITVFLSLNEGTKVHVFNFYSFQTSEKWMQTYKKILGVLE